MSFVRMVTAGETENLPTAKADKSRRFRAIWFGGCVSFGGEISCILGRAGWICKGFVKEKGRFVLRKVTGCMTNEKPLPDSWSDFVFGCCFSRDKVFPDLTSMLTLLVIH